MDWEHNNSRSGALFENIQVERKNFDLRHAGYNIVGEWVTTAGMRYVRYRLEDDDEEEI